MELIYTKELLNKKSLLTEEFSKIFSKGDAIAIKFHCGEKGNKTSLKPEYARLVSDALKCIGARPFLFDSSVIYSGARNTPKDHKRCAQEQGFSQETIGCPLVFSDEFTIVKTKNLDCEVCSPLLEADGMVVLTHVKGHSCSGMGASIKNLGMGGVSKKTKADIHDMAKVEYTSGCTACGICQRICPAGGIKVTDHPEISSCFGCDACYENCPEKCFRIKGKPFDLLLSESASAVIKGISKAYYINVMKDVTKFCDCMRDSGRIMAPDSGVLLGKDIVAIDNASADIIINKAGKDIFRKEHHKSAYGHIFEAEKLMMGSTNYTLTEV